MPTDPAHRQRVWPALGLLAVVACVAIASPASPGSSGFLLAAYEHVTHPALDSVAPAEVLAALAVLVFLTQSANLITRAAIGLVQSPDSAALIVHSAPSSSGRRSSAPTRSSRGCSPPRGSCGSPRSPPTGGSDRRQRPSSSAASRAGRSRPQRFSISSRRAQPEFSKLLILTTV